MRSFLNTIFSPLLSSLESYLGHNSYSPQAQSSPQVFGRTMDEQPESDGPVDKKHSNDLYCRYKRTASAGSMKYWDQNGHEGNVSDLDQFSVTLTSELDPSLPISLSEIAKENITYLEADKIEVSPRLDPIARCITPHDVPDLTFDTSLITATGTDVLDLSSTSSSESPLTPDLPSISFSPLLRANRLSLDADASRKASHFGMMAATTLATSGKESRPLLGLGIFDLTRKEDCSRPFDGLGVVHIQSSPWRRQNSKTSLVQPSDGVLDEGEQDDTQRPDHSHRISETFLHDLEAFFLIRDSTSRPLSFSSPCNGDECTGRPISESPMRNTSSMILATGPLPLGSRNCLSPHTSTPAGKKLARRLKNAFSLAPRQGESSSSIPSTQVASTSSCLAITTSPTHTCMPTPSSSSSSSISFGMPTSVSGSRSTAFVRRTCSALTLFRRDARPSFSSSSRPQHPSGADAYSDTISLSTSARHLTMSVSMGLPSVNSPSPSFSHNTKSDGIAPVGLGNWYLQSHSVLKDLSVIPTTISSDLKSKDVISFVV